MDSLISDGVVFVFQWIGVLLNFITGLFLILSGFLVNVATTFNFNILSENNTILKAGWLAARDIANLGFVILAIGSALATVLRYPPEYDVRKLLPKFIAAAILVNFSMTLAAIPIQFSNVLTGFFLSRVTSVSNQGSADLSGPLVNILGPQKLLTGDSDPLPPDPGDSAGGAISAVIFASLATLIFNVVFTLLMAILLLAFAVMLISRYFILTFLIIFSPLACLFYIFPALKDKWSLWNSEYVKWVFVGPGMMFFVYMAITVAEKLPGTALQNTGGNVVMAGLSGLLEQFINLSFVTAILVMGIIAASKTGTAAGTMALKFAKGAGNGVKKVLKNRAELYGQKISESGSGQKLQKILKGTSEKLVVQDTDSKGVKFGKRMASILTGGATSAIGEGAKFGSNKIEKSATGEKVKKAGLFGTVLESAGKEAGWQKEKEKKQETKGDAEKKLGDLTKRRQELVSNGLSTKQIDEEIDNQRRKIYRYRKEEFDADYMQAPEQVLDEAIKKADKGKNPNADNEVKEKLNLNIESIDVEKEPNKITNNKDDLGKITKRLVKGVLEDENNDKSDVKHTASRQFLASQVKVVNEKISKLKALKKDISDEQKKALGILMNIENTLNAEIKNREEEIQILGSIRKRREGTEKTLQNVIGGKTISQSATNNEDDEYIDNQPLNPDVENFIK